MDRRAKKTPDYVKRVRRLLFNFELRGHGGEADIMFLYKFRAFILQRPVLVLHRPPARAGEAEGRRGCGDDNNNNNNNDNDNNNNICEYPAAGGAAL